MSNADVNDRIEPSKPEPKPVIAEAVAPEPAAPVIDTCTVVSGVVDGIKFQTRSAELTGSSAQILDDVANTLSQCDEVDVEISAHTDSVGDEVFNQILSERRARSVASDADFVGPRRY